MTTTTKLFNNKIEASFQEYCLQTFAKLKLRQAGYQEDIRRCSKGLAQVEEQIEEFSDESCREGFNEKSTDAYGSTPRTQAIKSMTGDSYGKATRSKVSSNSRGR